jgi:hypothetical protein
MVSSDLLDGLPATDRRHGDMAMNAGLWVRRLLNGGCPSGAAADARHALSPPDGEALLLIEGYEA